MRLNDHKIEGVPFVPAKLTGRMMTPEIVVLHDTAGRLEKFNSRDYLARSAAVSVHFVVERDGTISQLVPTNRRAAHAGKSSWQGRSDCNAFSIGIEIVNPGRLTRGVGGAALAWWGQDFGLGGAVGGYTLADIETPEHGKGCWMSYTPEQIEAVEGLLTALFAGIPTLKDIVGHWYISPRRKVDPNPLFPIDAIRARVLGRDDPADAAADEASEPFADPEAMVTISSPSGLNLRRWPSINPNVIAVIPDGAVVPVLRAGVFGGRQWLRVIYAGQEGWIVASYAAPVAHQSA